MNIYFAVSLYLRSHNIVHLTQWDLIADFFFDKHKSDATFFSSDFEYLISNEMNE
jgi:hypothetical protein